MLPTDIFVQYTTFPNICMVLIKVISIEFCYYDLLIQSLARSSLKMRLQYSSFFVSLTILLYQHGLFASGIIPLSGYAAGDDLNTTNPCLDPDDDSDNCVQADFFERSVEQFVSPELSAHLTALSGQFTKRIYPPRPYPTKALKRFAELPYPIPVGPSLFFCSLFLVLFSWYLRRALVALLHRTAHKLDLHPEIQEFPKLNLYSLQQSKREARLRREERNTWAWMAKKYLLMQNDPKVNVEVFRTTWSDFDLPKDVWGVVRTMIKAGAWMKQTKEKIRTSVKNVFNTNENKTKEDNNDPSGIDTTVKDNTIGNLDTNPKGKASKNKWQATSEEVRKMSKYVGHFGSIAEEQKPKEKKKSKKTPSAPVGKNGVEPQNPETTDMVQTNEIELPEPPYESQYELVEMMDEAVEVGGPVEMEKKQDITSKDKPNK